MAESPETAEDFSAFADLIPEDALPIAAWKIVLYVGQDGKQRANWTMEGEPDIHITIGCVQWALNDWTQMARDTAIEELEEGDD